TDTSILWLMGVAGSGKSSIAVSLAKYLHSASVCTAYYRFEAAKQHHLNPSNLFTTIALQLAAQNAVIEAQLLGLMRSTKDLQQRNEDPAEQLERFLLPLLKGHSTTLIPIVIIIDALDESGGVRARRKLLKALASLAPHLPSTVHILITSRPELDILDMVEILPQLPNVSSLFMDALPNQSTEKDISHYISHMLEGPPLNPTQEQLENLSSKAQLSFQWASTACLYIVDQEDGNQAVSPSKRLKNVLSTSSAASSQVTLYTLYSTLMDAQFGQSTSGDLELLRLLLGVLVVKMEPLSLATLLKLLHTCLLYYGEIGDVEAEAVRGLGLLSSLIAGTRSHTPNMPLLPLHTSFLDFLQDSASNPKYCVDISKTHRLLTESCFAVMQSGEKKLKFNICQLTTSFLPNSSIPQLPTLIEDNIGSTLSYACHFWASHLVSAKDVTPSTLNAIKNLLSTPQFLYWLEVMSLTDASPTAALSLVVAQVWFCYLRPTSEISVFAVEALLFSTYYAIPMALSAPHIYLSAVPFIPTTSTLQMIGTEHPQTALISTGHLERWPALRHVLKHEYAVYSVAISKNGIVAAGLLNGTILLWSMQAGEKYGDPLHHSHGVECVAFSHDGAVLASGSSDHTIQLWDVQSHSPKGNRLKGHNCKVTSVAFSCDGAFLASGSDDQTIQLWDVQSCTPKGDPLRGHSDYVKSVAFSPDGALLASGSDDGTIQLWDVQSCIPRGDPLKSHTGLVQSVAFSHDGAVLASGSSDYTIQLWDVQSCTPKGDPLRGHSDWVRSLWDVQSQTSKGDPLMGHSGLVHSVAFSCDGTLLASGSYDETIQLWDVQSQIPKGNTLRGHSSSVSSVAFSHDGAILASGSSDRTVQLWDVQSQTPKGDPLRCHSGLVNSVAFSHDGAVLASGSSDQTIQLWDVQSHTPKGDPLKGHSGSVQSVAFSHDGAVLASGSDDQTIQLWDVQSYTPKGDPLRGHSGKVTTVAFSPNGAVLASGSKDHTIWLWDLQSHTPKGHPLGGHSEWVNSVAFSPDGAVLASGSDDQTIQLWGVQSQTPKGDPLRGHSGPVNSVAFSTDGEVLASGSKDKTVRLWHITSSALFMVVPIPHSQSPTFRLSPAWPILLDDGWVKGPNNELILWVPPSYRNHLYDERLIAVLGEDPSSRVRLNFDNMVLGEDWAKSYTPCCMDND
ncbi:WD40 repeat-like protein, partial [Clavulina sp. PMI_390]